jgi:hypothetical protein
MIVATGAVRTPHLEDLAGLPKGQAEAVLDVPASCIGTPWGRLLITVAVPLLSSASALAVSSNSKSRPV